MKLFIYTATKSELYGHEWNFRDVEAVACPCPMIQLTRAGAPFEEDTVVNVQFADGTMLALRPEDLGNEDTYWIKVWPENRWIRLTTDDTPSAAHLHPL